MNNKNIGYHTRLADNNSVKIVGGSFGGQVDMDTVNRLVKSHFTVTIKNSGRAVFVDRTGREVSLYITVDPLSTVIGKKTKSKYQEEERKRIIIQQKIDDDNKNKIEELMDGLSMEEIIERLSK